MFCTFVVMNGGCRERNEIFHSLSKYKQVASGGALFNNIGGILSREGSDFHLSKFAFLKQGKFNLCYENSSFPGYVTEKIYQALYCNTIPIYWGSPTVAMDFNREAYISRHNYNTDAEMIEHIIELDNNDDMYNKMLQQPILNPYNNVLDLNNLLKWFGQNVYKG